MAISTVGGMGGMGCAGSREFCQHGLDAADREA